MPREVLSLIRPFITETGHTIESGYVKYPEVEFSQDLLDQAINIE